MILLASATLCAWGQVSNTAVLSQAEVEQLEITVQQVPYNTSAQTLLGKNYAYFILGVTGYDSYGLASVVDKAKSQGEFAKHAAAVMADPNTLPGILAEGGKELWNDSFATLGSVDQQAPAALAIKALDLAILSDPDNTKWRSYRIPIVVFRSNFSKIMPLSYQEAYRWVTADFAVLGDLDHRFQLTTVAKLAVRAGVLEDATAFAQEMTSKLGDKFYGLWLDGDYVFTANMVFGQVAIRNQDVEAAKSYLMLSGQTTGSPTLNSFGPNMSLAKDLLDAGEGDAVLGFFDQCRSFWKLDYGSLDKWSAQVSNGEMPKFGANLVY